MPQTMYIWKYVDVYDYTNDSSFSLAYILLLSYGTMCLLLYNNRAIYSK